MVYVPVCAMVILLFVLCIFNLPAAAVVAAQTKTPSRLAGRFIGAPRFELATGFPKSCAFLNPFRPLI